MVGYCPAMLRRTPFQVVVAQSEHMVHFCRVSQSRSRWHVVYTRSVREGGTVSEWRRVVRGHCCAKMLEGLRLTATVKRHVSLRRRKRKLAKAGETRCVCCSLSAVFGVLGRMGVRTAMPAAPFPLFASVPCLFLKMKRSKREPSHERDGTKCGFG